MSYTGIYTKFVTKDGDYPKILDMEGLKESLRRIGFEDFLKIRNEEKGAILELQEYTDDKVYPKQVHQTIKGFRTWQEEIYSDQNLERCAIGYDGGDTLFLILEAISKNCEDFKVLHSDFENDWGFPHKIDDDKEICYYEISCSKGIVSCKKIVFKEQSSEEVYKTEVEEEC